MNEAEAKAYNDVQEELYVLWSPERQGFWVKDNQWGPLTEDTWRTPWHRASLSLHHHATCLVPLKFAQAYAEEPKLRHDLNNARHTAQALHEVMEMKKMKP